MRAAMRGHDALFSGQDGGRTARKPRCGPQGLGRRARRESTRSRGPSSTPRAARSHTRALGGPDKGHIDIIGADGKVMCSSRPLKNDSPDAGYANSVWLARALTRAMFLAPVRDDIVGAQMAIASSPIPGGKGVVAAFAYFVAFGPTLSTLYGGGRPNEFLVTTADNFTVVTRSSQTATSIGTRPLRGDVARRPALPGATSTGSPGCTPTQPPRRPAGTSTSARTSRRCWPRSPGSANGSWS